jgi:nucleotide-binding universal stress UspA family protein
MTLATKRRCYEAGHRPKILVVIDETEECERAVYFAARRAKRQGAMVAMLALIEPKDFQNWFSVGDVMREEAEAEATGHLDRHARRILEIAGIEPQRILREGKASEEIQALIAEDEDIALLILAAGTGTEGPGPLVTQLAGKTAGTFPIPLMIVPGHLTDDEIDTLS